MTLPPLPEPDLGSILVGRETIALGHSDEAMRAYGEACAAAERERCANLCEDIGDEYQRSEGRKYPELKSDAETGASKCAAAIRAGAAER